MSLNIVLDATITIMPDEMSNGMIKIQLDNSVLEYDYPVELSYDEENNYLDIRSWKGTSYHIPYEEIQRIYSNF